MRTVTKMKTAICRFIYHHLLRWKAEVSVPDFKKCIICAAPHTSNLDLLMGKLFIGSIGRKAGFMMKKEWFVWPLGGIFRAMGGIAVNRGKASSLVNETVKKAQESETFNLAITPEGTRKANPRWKKGFYNIALDAGMPIVLLGIDYKKRLVSATKYLIPSGNYEEDIAEIKAFFCQFTARHPAQFAI